MHNHVLRGMALMAVSIFLIITMNMLAKLVTDTHGFLEAVFYRNLVAFSLITAFIALQRKQHLYKTSRPRGQVMRAIAGNVGMSFVFWAYSLMPMAEVTAIMFTGGLMTTAMSAVVLKEYVGPYRWSAVIIGFLGAFLIVSSPTGKQSNH